MECEQQPKPFVVVHKENMKIEFKNFAKVGSGIVNINKLTVICGPNNSGKSYVNYAVFSIFENMEKYFDIGMNRKEINSVISKLERKNSIEIDVTDKISNISKQIEKIESKIVKGFSDDFSVPENYFPNLKIKLDLDCVNFLEKTKFNGNKKYVRIKYRNTGNLFNVRFMRKKSKLKIVLSLDELGEEYSYYSMDRSEQINIIKYLINRVLYRNIFGDEISKPFSISSERTGIALFYKSFDKTRDEITELEDSANSHIFSFPLPIRKNINLVREYGNVSKKKSFITKEPKKYSGILNILAKFLNDGGFDTINGSLMFSPSDKSKINEPKTPLQVASSSIKSLFLLDVFVKHIASDNHILIIDEPELNLFPVNQVRMARLVAKLVNNGVRVLVTTHSDFFIREINNLVTLGNVANDNKYKNEVMKLYEFEDDEILESEHVSAYMTTDSQSIEPIEINKFGIDTELLDSIIQKENNKARDVSLLVEGEE